MSVVRDLDFQGTTTCPASSNSPIKKYEVQGTSYLTNEAVWSIVLQKQKFHFLPVR